MAAWSRGGSDRVGWPSAAAGAQPGLRRDAGDLPVLRTSFACRRSASAATSRTTWSSPTACSSITICRLRTTTREATTGRFSAVISGRTICSAESTARFIRFMPRDCRRCSFPPMPLAGARGAIITVCVLAALAALAIFEIAAIVAGLGDGVGDVGGGLLHGAVHPARLGALSGDGGRGDRRLGDCLDSAIGRAVRGRLAVAGRVSRQCCPHLIVRCAPNQDGLLLIIRFKSDHQARTAPRFDG